MEQCCLTDITLVMCLIIQTHKPCSRESGKDCQETGSQVWTGTSQASSAPGADVSQNHTFSICRASKLPSFLMHGTHF